MYTKAYWKNTYSQFDRILLAYFKVILLLFALAIGFLTYKQVTGAYPSDWNLHLDLALNRYAQEGYSLFHTLSRWVTNLIKIVVNASGYFIMSLVFIVMCILAFFSSLFLVQRYLSTSGAVSAAKVGFFSLSLLILSMVIINPSGPFYIASGTPNPWHNPTYVISRPFAILFFIYAIKFLNDEHYISAKHLILFSLSGILSMWAKPSFLISFLPAYALIACYSFYRKKLSFKNLFLIGVTTLPCLLPLYFINTMMFHNAEDANKIIISFGTVWSHYSKNIPLSIVLSIAFPAFVFVVSPKRFSLESKLVWLNYFFALSYYLFLAEGGGRMYHGNFFWTYMFALFFLFLVSVKAFFIDKSIMHKPYIFRIGIIIFCLHLFSGIYYFFNVLGGFSYH